MAVPESLVLMIQDVVYNGLKRKRNRLMEDDKDMTVPESLVLMIQDVVCNELKRKRNRLMEDDLSLMGFFDRLDEFGDEIDRYFLDLYNIVPPQHINEEDIRQTLLDISNDSLRTEMWLTYCKDLALEDTLRGLEHDHCYSNTSQYNGLVGLPKSSVNNNVTTSNTITKSSPSLYLMGSEDETESNDMDCDTFNQTSSSCRTESLYGLEHDHCYPNTSQYNGLVGLPKSTVNNNVTTSNTITKSSPSLYLMGSEDETESNDMDCDTFNQTLSSYTIESSDDCDTLKQTSSSFRTESPYMTDSNIAYAHTLYQTLSSSAIDSTDVTESYIMDFYAVSQITAILEELVYKLCYRLPYDIRTAPHFARYLIKSSDGTESYDLDYDKFFQNSFTNNHRTQLLLDVLLNEINKKVSSSNMDSGVTPVEDLCDSPTKFLN